MGFDDVYVSAELYFAVGVEAGSGEYYLSVPVRNSRVDYPEYYRLPAELYRRHALDLAGLAAYADECRRREHDDDLFLQPGRDRGEAW
jgi:hypothetical protein